MAEDKIATTQRELAVTGAGIGGSIVGGALAGLACGSGALVCVAVGAFVGGAVPCPPSAQVLFGRATA